MSLASTHDPSLVLQDSAAAETQRRLRDVASAQRQVSLAVLFYLCMVPVNVILSIMSEGAAWAGIVFGVVALCVLGFGAVSIFKLAALFRGKAVAIIYVLGFLIPLLGLLLLVSINHKATKLLKGNGIKVGFLGADPKSV